MMTTTLMMNLGGGDREKHQVQNECQPFNKLLLDPFLPSLLNLETPTTTTHSLPVRNVNSLSYP
jgi:hypothetical protein